MCSDLLNTFEEIMLLRIRCRYAASIDTEFIILNEIYFFLLQFLHPFHFFLSGEQSFVQKRSYGFHGVHTHLLTGECHHFPLNLVMILFTRLHAPKHLSVALYFLYLSPRAHTHTMQTRRYTQHITWLSVVFEKVMWWRNCTIYVGTRHRKLTSSTQNIAHFYAWQVLWSRM